MRPRLARHVRPQIARGIRGTTDSEWIYALVASQLAEAHEAHEAASGAALVAAVKAAIAILREERRQLGIDTSSSLNLFVTDGCQVVAVRYCFDFGRYATADAAKLHEANLGFLSLWFTAGPDYGPPDGGREKDGGAEDRPSHLIAPEAPHPRVPPWVVGTAVRLPA